MPVVTYSVVVVKGRGDAFLLYSIKGVPTVRGGVVSLLFNNMSREGAYPILL